MLRSKSLFRITLVLLIMLINSGTAFACICSPISVVDNFQRSDFIAIATILKVSQDPENADYHVAALELLHIYKGKRLETIKISSELNSSCAFLPKANSTWLIFASEWKGVLSFGMCSGSEQLDKTFARDKYFQAAFNYKGPIGLRLQTLGYLKDRRIKNPNEYGLIAYSSKVESIKGFSNKNKFAVYQIDVNENLSVKGIKVLRKFKNRALNDIVLHSLTTNLKFFSVKSKKLPAWSRVIVFCYYYEKERAADSFLSLSL